MGESFFKAPPDSCVFCVGIKGTGMSALAELLLNAGLRVTGSDTGDVFYTDAILKELGIPYFETFDAAHIREGIALVIHSAAYSPETNPELLEASRRGIPILKYADALGAYSAGFDSSGIAGVHGKTTTTALTGALLKGARLPAQVLAGSAVRDFGGHSTLSLGSTYFVAETCEYRRHFLSFHPRRIVLTGVESDHQDYYPTYESIRDAFVEYGRKLPHGGELIYCADNEGACEVVEILKKLKSEKRGITFTPYGFTAQGDFRIKNFSVENERIVFEVNAFAGPFILRTPGKHNALNAAAALALVSSIVRAENGAANRGLWTKTQLEGARRALEHFCGSKRRSEIIGEQNGVLFMDDYAHHPTAIKTTLEGIRAFYPGRRLIVSFMPHTYSRTAALLDEFATAFTGADVLVLHKIYASARETRSYGITGKTLFEKIEKIEKIEKTEPLAPFRKKIFYTEEPLDALPLIKPMLRAGDLFLTMGAGDNWKLGKALLEKI
ncbi:MAG: UDP-N-acetylmuramate--L-alanine ligase [Treponema sp.]|jgi:UDP-N-acetylmuramate--alanine ligase|nr:UDP-N-acetylmuramate--L-alanine ligase [Treponema sp.]